MEDCILVKNNLDVMDKKLIKIVAFFLCLFCSSFTYAGDCELRISVAPIKMGENVPASISDKLESRLMRVVSSQGVVADPVFGQFFITGRFDDELNDIMSGTSQKNIVKTTLTLYIADSQNRQIYATESFDLKGVGNSEERAYIKALNGLSASNTKLQQFVNKAKTKIINYFDNNYKTYIAKAQTAMKTRSYEEALYHVTAIPECCKGFDEARNLTLSIYKDYIDYEGVQLLAKARGAWGADPTEYGATEAYGYLSQIDPKASCYSEAVKLGNQIQKTVKANWDFENVKKYNDQISLEKMQIKAARDVAVAWGENQPKEIYHYDYYWIW